jgi:hypothetical protein
VSDRISPKKQIKQTAVLLGALLAVTMLLLAIVAAQPASAAPSAHASGNPLAQAGSGKNPSDPNANYVAQYLETKGYTVVNVGYLKDNNGNANTDQVAVIMNFASTKYDPSSGLPTTDQDTVNQVVLGFYSLHKYFVKPSVLVVVLAYQNNYLFVFPARAADWQAVLDDNSKADSFWQTVTSNFVILDSNGNVVDPSGFSNKNFGGGDFSGQGNNGPTSPTDNPTNNPVDPASGHDAGAGYLRLIPSSAYLPSDSNSFYLIGAVSDKNYSPAVGQKVAFSLKVTGKQEQQIGNVQQTDNNGTARVQVGRVTANGQVAMKVTCAASSDPTSCGDVTVGGPAAAVVVVGSGNLSADAGKQALNDAMTAQGYSVEQVDYQESQGVTGDTIAAAVLVMDMASKRYDQTLRTQMFSGFGTMFTIFPRAKNGILGLVYPNGGKTYVLVYQVNRTDWEAYVQGKTDETGFWKQVTLGQVIDAQTGQSVQGGKDFVNKNFAGNSGSNGGQVRPRKVESTLSVEEWGPQPTDDNIIVPLGGYADSFTVNATGSGDKSWSIYSVEDTSKPVYQSKTDSSGSKLKDLILQSGNYILMVEDPDPPQGTPVGTVVEDIKVQYSEHLP